MKFTFGGNRGTTIPDIFAQLPDSDSLNPADYPVSRRHPKDPTATPNPIEQTVTAGQSSFSYDPLTDQYTYLWKTSKAWGDDGGQSRELVVKLTDGTEHTALFRFTK